MPLSTDRILNEPLTGPELAQYCKQILVDELEQRSVPAGIVEQIAESLRSACANDWLFSAGNSYPNVRVQLTIRLHWVENRAAFSIDPQFDLENPLYSKHSVFVRSQAPPLVERGGEERVECFTMSVKITNPNAVRVHFNLPILVQKRVDPKPGEMFPQFKSEQIEYDRSEVEEPEAPTVTDESDEYARKWGASITTVPVVFTPQDHPGSVHPPVDPTERRQRKPRK